jgi:PAS domain-containing protein
MLRDCKPQRFAPAIITLALLVLNMAVQFLRAAPLIGSIVTAALAASVLWLLFEHHRILKSQYDLCAAIRKTAEDIIDKPAAIKSADDIDALETFRTLVQRFTESNDRLKKDMRQRIEELSRSEADLLFLSNALPLGVLLKVLDGPVVFANAHWDQLFAFLKNDNGGKEWECWERWVHPDDVGRMRNIWKTTREQFS